MHICIYIYILYDYMYIYKNSKSRFFSILAFQDSQATDICMWQRKGANDPSYFQVYGWDHRIGRVELEDENATRHS